MDNNGIPIAYDLFPENESEKLQMRPTLKKTKAKFRIDRTIIVADRGQKKKYFFLQPVTNINNKIIKIIFSSLFYLM